MTANTAKNYLVDLATLLKELAKDAKADKDASRDGCDRAYHVGRLMAFHEVISLMQQQAGSFCIPLKDIGLEGIDPERDLV